MKTSLPRILPNIIQFGVLPLWLGMAAISAPAAENSPTALMVVAHGSHNAEWNQRVIQTVEKLTWAGPKGVAFLTSPSAEHKLAAVAAELDATGAGKIVVVPLFVSSFSGHYEEIRYYVGQRQDLPHEGGEEHEHAHMTALKTRAPLLLTPAMDGHAVVSQILADEVKPFVKQNPGKFKQSVVLVAHGPNENGENEQWLTHLRTHARRLQEQFGLQRVEVTTLRDDAAKEVREAATEQLRAMVREAAGDSQVLVLPVLISVGHVQKEIRQRLEGLEFTMVEGGVANHPLAAEWIRQQAVQAGAKGCPVENALSRSP